MQYEPTLNQENGLFNHKQQNSNCLGETQYTLHYKIALPITAVKKDMRSSGNLGFKDVIICYRERMQ